MKVATVAETVTVSGASPIVDTKATGTATNFTSDELQKIPTSRDPFALMRGVPGVLVDRVNIGGNETGQQSNFASKGTRPQDASWTLDGVEVTDMAATGASPTYFNYDNFEEIQVSTAGNDIKARTGGIGLNMVIKRGTNQFRGSVRGYFDNESMESSNVPDELKATGVTHETSDHNKQISDYGGELGGPIFRNKAWFYGSYSIQDVRLVRRAGALIDRTQLKNPNVKVNWQASKKDNISFLYLDGFKIKDGRSPGVSGILFDAPTATYHQDNAYEDTPFHGLWKVADDHVFGTKLFVSGLYLVLQHRVRARSDRRAVGAGGPQLRDRDVVRIGQPGPQRPAAAHRDRQRAVLPQRLRRIARREGRIRVAAGRRDQHDATGRAT